ncbi:maleylpyruvate isomerase family mycothiol-dependent enzyme [Gordonia sp. NPDC003504]
MPTTTLSATDLVPALIGEWAALRALAADLDDAQWSAPSILPGWTNADIIAHIVGTERMLDGRDVTAPDGLAGRDHVRNPIGELNEKWVEYFRTQSRAEVLEAFDEVIAARTAALRAMTQAEFDADAFTPAGPDTYGRFMRIRVFDCWIHEVDLRDATIGGAPDEAATAWVLDEISASLPFVVGKRAGAPDGTTVVFDISGPAARTIRIAVNGRARLVDSFDGGDDSADVTLRLEAADLARLAGGRTSARRERVTVIGDQDLGTAILDRMDYVI